MDNIFILVADVEIHCEIHAEVTFFLFAYSSGIC